MASTALDGVAGPPVERKEKVKDDAAAAEKEENKGLHALYDDGFGGVTVKDYFAAAKAVSRDDGGPPRWFCPVECGRPAVDGAPLLLFLPGTRSLSWPVATTDQSLPRLHIPKWRNHSGLHACVSLMMAEQRIDNTAGTDGVGMGLILHHKSLGK